MKSNILYLKTKSIDLSEAELVIDTEDVVIKFDDGETCELKGKAKIYIFPKTSPSEPMNHVLTFKPEPPKAA